MPNGSKTSDEFKAGTAAFNYETGNDDSIQSFFGVFKEVMSRMVFFIHFYLDFNSLKAPVLNLLEIYFKPPLTCNFHKLCSQANITYL